MSIGIGEALREARQQSGVRLADAAAETRIRETHLLALEEENFGRIGGDVYVKGFIRSYARHLGIDPRPLIRAYQSHYAAEEEGAWVGSEPIETPPPPRRPITTIVVVLAVLTIGGLALLGFLVPDEDTPSDELAAPDPVEEETAPPDEDDEGDVDGEPSDPVDPSADTTEGDGDEPDEANEDDGNGVPEITDEVVLTLSVPNGRSWARVIVDGEHVEEATFESGHSETYTGEEIVVRLGDASSVSLEVNGEDLELGGSVVDISCSSAAGECEIG